MLLSWAASHVYRWSKFLLDEVQIVCLLITRNKRRALQELILDNHMALIYIAYMKPQGVSMDIYGDLCFVLYYIAIDI